MTRLRPRSKIRIGRSVSAGSSRLANPRTSANGMKSKNLPLAVGMRPEYHFDYSKAVRGKYYKRYLEGTNVVVLEPDVAKQFKNSASVNKVLRAFLKGSKRGPTTGSTATAKLPRKRTTR